MITYRLRGEFTCTSMSFRGLAHTLVDAVTMPASVAIGQQLSGMVETMMLKQFGVAHPYRWVRLHAQPVARDAIPVDGAQPYLVYVDDNFHYMDESYRYTLGSYATAEAALAAARQVVDEYLDANRQPDDTPADLLARYRMFGEDPWIPGVVFSAWDYAAKKSAEVMK